MPNKYQQPTRREILRGLGVSLALPWLESLAPAATRTSSAPPKMLFLYVPNGVNVNKWRSPNAAKIAPTLEPLNDFREQFTQLTGLGHPNAKGGHSGADTWLTGADLAATPGYDYHNQISVDQVAAETIGKETRFRSIELSTRSGSGIPGHSNTLAFNRHGVPLPAQNSPRTLFDRLFSPDQSDSLRNRRHRIDEKLSIIDTVLEHAGNVQRRLSNNDRRKMDEYLESVREIERRVQRDQKWLSIAKPRIDASKFQLDLRPDYTNRRAYYRLMYDLIVLALQTDSTRIVTFQVGREAAGGRFNELGITATHHELSHHGGAADMLSKLAKIDRFHIENFRYLLGRLKATKLLDSTTILYGSGMNSGQRGGHSPKDLPLIVAGGRDLGIKHRGQTEFQESTPMSNVLLTMLHAVGVKENQFQDSTGDIREILS